MSLRSGLLSLLAVTLILGLTAWMWAPLNQDEGWYLLSARHTAAGAMPYRDYAFTQGPVFPYAYSLFNPVVRRFGLAGGRAVTLILGWGTLALTAGAAFRFRKGNFPWYAVFVVLALLGASPFLAQYLATVKTYALASLLLTLALTFLLQHYASGRWPALICSAFFLALAAGTRLSLLAFFPPLILEACWHQRKHSLGHLLLFPACCLLALGLLFLPFVVQAPEAVGFAWRDFHTGRSTGNPWLVRAGFFSRSLQHMLPFLLASLPLLWHRRHWMPGTPGIAGGILLTTAVHAFSPFPYDDYQAVVLPAFAFVLALHFPFSSLSSGQRKAFVTAVPLFGIAFALGAPQWQTWFSLGRDRIWWQEVETPPLVQLRRTAERVHALAPEATSLLTSDAYLAVEANLEVPIELNMGPFSYFPQLTSEEAKKFHVLNTETLLELLDRTPAPVAALSGYGFTIQSPAIAPTPPETLQRFHEAMARNYIATETIPNFGQAYTPLTLYKARPDSVAPDANRP